MGNGGGLDTCKSHRLPQPSCQLKPQKWKPLKCGCTWAGDLASCTRNTNQIYCSLYCRHKSKRRYKYSRIIFKVQAKRGNRSVQNILQINCSHLENVKISLQRLVVNFDYILKFKLPENLLSTVQNDIYPIHNQQVMSDQLGQRSHRTSSKKQMTSGCQRKTFPREKLCGSGGNSGKKNNT